MNVSPEQLGQWLDRWAGPLRAWLRGRCASPEDVAQEAFCRLVQQTRTPERVSAWLFQVAANLAKEETRRGRRESRRAELLARPAAHSDDGDRYLEADEIRRQIERLSDELREVVVARLWGDLTFQEIGPLVGISPATAHRRYEQALAQLRTALQAHAADEK